MGRIRSIGNRLRAGGGGFPQTSDVVDLFIVCGQSNAEGRGTSALSPIGQAGIYITGSTITPPPMTDPVGGANTGSMWPAFSNEWAIQTGRKSAFVECAVGGTAILDDAGGQWGASGTLRAAAVAACNSAISAINDSAYTLGGVYFLWAQGEQEASTLNGTTITGALYEQALEDLAAYFKGEVGAMVTMGVIQTGGADEIEFGVATMSATSNGHQTIRRAQENACADSANLTMLYRGTYSFIGRRLMKDGVHYNQAGLNLAGKCAARELANPAAEPDAISPYISSTAYPDASFGSRATRSADHTTDAATTMLVLAVMAQREANQLFVVAASFGGVSMRLLATANSKSATPGSVVVSLFYLDASLYGASLSSVTASIQVTAAFNCSMIDWCAINAKDVELAESEYGFFPAGTTASAGAVTMNTYQPALVVTVAGSAATSSSALTNTFTNATELMDHGLTNGSRSAQIAVGYSAESAALVDQSITATWTAACTQIAVASVAFRKRIIGE